MKGLSTKWFVSLLLLLAFAGCGGASVMREGDPQTAMAMLSPNAVRWSHEVQIDPPSEPIEALYYLLPPELKDLDDEQRLQSSCSIGPSDKNILPVFATFVIGIAIDFILNQIEQKLVRKMEQYSAAYSHSISVPFYGADLATELPQWHCFRLTRFKDKAPDDKTLEAAMDFVGQFGLVFPNGETKPLGGVTESDRFPIALRVRPLRIYYAYDSESPFLAETDDGTIALAIAAHARSVWMESVVGRQEQSFYAKIASVTLDTKKPMEMPSDGGKALYVFFGPGSDNEMDWNAMPALPLIPRSFDIEENIHSSITEFGVDVAEVGAPSELLKFFVKAFGANKDDIGALLKDAATSRIVAE
jgi:hypothetical protein